MKNVCVIAAHGIRGQIGYKGKLPWKLPAEMRLFQEATKDAVVIMGRKTWESLPGPLKGRHNVVITSQPKAKFEGAFAYKTLEAALEAHKDFTSIFIIGGKRLFAEGIKIADHAILSEVDYDGPGTVRIPVAFFRYVRERFASDILKREPEFTTRLYTRLPT